MLNLVDWRTVKFIYEFRWGFCENFRELETNHWHQPKGCMEVGCGNHHPWKPLSMATTTYGNNCIVSWWEPGFCTKGHYEISCVLSKPQRNPLSPLLQPVPEAMMGLSSQNLGYHLKRKRRDWASCTIWENLEQNGPSLHYWIR